MKLEECVEKTGGLVQGIDMALLQRYAHFIKRFEEKNAFQKKYNGLSRYGFAGICALVAHPPFVIGFTLEAFVQSEHVPPVQQIMAEASLFMTLYSVGILLPAWWRARKEFYYQQQYKKEIEAEVEKEKDAVKRELGNVIPLNAQLQFDSHEEGNIRESIEQRIFPYDTVSKYARATGKALRLPFLLPAFGFLGKAVYEVYEGIKNTNNMHFLEAGTSLQFAIGFFLTTNALYFSDANPVVYGRKLY